MVIALPVNLHLTINTTRLRHELDELAEIGKTREQGVSRLALSNEDLEARIWLSNKIEDAGLALRDDDVANLSGILYSHQPHAKTLLIGSHLDTVPNDGRFNGAVGVLAGLECLRRIREAQLELPFHLEVINFTDNEGTWQAFFGSMGLTGALRETFLRDWRQDRTAFRAALSHVGIQLNDAVRARRDPSTVAGYLELHIEQGDLLYRQQQDIGIVTGVVGRTTFHITFTGEAAHAATTPRHKRRDALLAASHYIVRLHELTQQYPEGIFNCGNVQVKPGAFNVIPAQALLNVECRHPNETTLLEIEHQLQTLAHEIAQQQQLQVECQRGLHRPAATMSEGLLQVIEQVCAAQPCQYQRMVSLAGHDAQIMSSFTPSAMIFIPSVEGISHNPREFTDWRHVELGANVLLQTILRLAFGSH
jgi:hydantoinase/carbamoylase family amidase